MASSRTLPSWLVCSSKYSELRSHRCYLCGFFSSGEFIWFSKPLSGPARDVDGMGSCQPSKLHQKSSTLPFDLVINFNWTSFILTFCTSRCLSCFFLAASPNPWLQAMFPHLQHRQPAASPSSPPSSSSSTPHEDKRLFCLAAADFYAGLSDQRQKEKFIQTFESVAAPGSPYADLLATVEHRSEAAG